MNVGNWRFKIVVFPTFFVYSPYLFDEKVKSMRNDVYERMKHFVIEDIKSNYTAIARQYGVDPRTVKAAYLRALNGQDPSYNHQRHRRRSKLDEYRDIIESKYAADCSARSIFDFIVEKGFTGKCILPDFAPQIQLKYRRIIGQVRSHAKLVEDLLALENVVQHQIVLGDLIINLIQILVFNDFSAHLPKPKNGVGNVNRAKGRDVRLNHLRPDSHSYSSL